MNFSELVAKRESCRHFSTEAVPHSLIAQIAEAGRLAPSECNSQPWSFYIVTGGDASAMMQKGLMALGTNQFVASVTNYIVVVSEAPNYAERVADAIYGRDFASVDIGLAISQMILQSTALGLGSCVIGGFSSKFIKQALALPRSDKRKIRVVIALGYPVDTVPRSKNRKNADEVVKWVPTTVKERKKETYTAGQSVQASVK